MFIRDPDLDFSLIPDPGSRVKKAPDPGFGSATLIFWIFMFIAVHNLLFLNQENTVLEVRRQEARIGGGES
jgi:hypothetical protein